jgi:hypothetical protein
MMTTPEAEFLLVAQVLKDDIGPAWRTEGPRTKTRASTETTSSQ